MEKTLFLSLILLLGGVFSVPQAQAAALPSASCSGGSFTISNLPQDDRRVAIRLNDKANDWNLDKPLKGDYAGIISPHDGKFMTRGTDGHRYDWWVHIENADGTFGKAIGGTQYCGVAAPSSVSASCSNDSLTLHWNSVNGADHYAVRVDDAHNSWNPKSMQPGDTADDSVSDTKFSTSAQTSHGYNVWVHAVDRKGNFSSPKSTYVACRKEASSGFGASLSAFFRNLFK